MQPTFPLPLMLLIALTAVTVGRAETGLRRWAVIAANSVEQSGLSDLLTVHLAQDESIQLVERERLQEAMRELQLAPLMQAERIDQRLRLGQTLRADALMVLSIEQRDERLLLRVVVCDCVLGVRLWHGNFAYDTSNIDRLVKQCAATVSEVRQRFARGVHHIVAVPPFLSEDFEHRFDYLQSRYSNRLSGVLMLHAGVAVVEIEEADAILRELQNTLAGGLQRPIAAIVKGKYCVGPLDETNQRTVELRIELLTGNTQELIVKTFKMGTVGHWLAGDFVKRLLAGNSTERELLGPDLQRAILTRHGQRFAELGDWQRSTSLREAALVLDPNDPLQRATLISEYQFGIDRDVDYVWFKNLPAGEQREFAIGRASDDYCNALQHLEFLVRNRLIKRNDAVGLFHTMKWCKDNAAPTLPHVRQYFAALQPACLAERRFVRDVYPEIIRLPRGRVLPERFSKPYYGWQYAVTKHVINDVCFHDYSAESLLSLRDLLVRVLPQDAKVSLGLLYLMNRPFGSGARDQARDDWLVFLTELTRSDRKVVKLYGHWGLLKASGRAPSSLATPGKIESLSAQIENVERHIAEVKRLGRIGEQAANSLDTDLTMTKKWLRANTSPSVPKPSPSAAVVAGVRESFGRMQFDPISLIVEDEQQSGRPPLIKGMLQCGEKCDAYWTNDQFFVMHRPGVLREMKLTDRQSDHASYSRVTWDGECIWLYAHGQGVVAVRPDGTRLATFSQEQLPGYWKGFSLLGLSPRRALIVASFGESNRAWCGILEIDEQGAQSVNVFFEAKYVAKGRLPEDAAADPETAFQPAWIHRHRLRHGKVVALVGRRGVPGALQIDLETLEVSVSGYDTHRVGRQAFFSHDGHLFASLGGNQLIHYSPPNRDGSIRSRVLADIRPCVDQLLPHDGWLYVPGRVWFRLAPDQRNPERLQPRPSRLPVDFWSLKGGVSAHYGLIAYDLYKYSPPLYQIRILEEVPEDRARGSER